MISHDDYRPNFRWMTGSIIWYFYSRPQTRRMCQDGVCGRMDENTVYTTCDSTQPAPSLVELLICTPGCWTSLNFSSRINAGGADGSPCRFYLKHAKSISTDRDTMQGASHISPACKLLPLIFPAYSRFCRNSAALWGRWRLTDRQLVSIKTSNNGEGWGGEGGVLSAATLEHRGADSLIHAIKALTAHVSVCMSLNAATQRCWPAEY